MRKTFQHLLDAVEVARLDLSQQDPDSVDVAGHKPAYYGGKLDDFVEVLSGACDGYDSAYAREQEKAAAEDPAVRNARLLAEQQASANQVPGYERPAPAPAPTPRPAPVAVPSGDKK